MFRVFHYLKLALIAVTFDKHHTMSELFRCLAGRLQSEKWIVVFKTLSLFHLLAREGNSERVQKEWPLMDYILSCTILDETETTT